LHRIPIELESEFGEGRKRGDPPRSVLGLQPSVTELVAICNLQ
jgi:hypothetical protein